MESLSFSPKERSDTKKLINIYGIAAGMKYLHSNGIIHRGLKTDNILLDDYLYPKISDFGLSKILDILSISMNIISQKGLKGTPLHMAPEILINEKYSKSSDIYAFAYIVYEIVTGKVPFSKMGIHQIYHQIAFLGTRPVIDEFIPMEFGELIEKC